MFRENLAPHLINDIDNISKIGAIPSILNVICRTTGMKFSAVARVTDEKWITCVSQDEINFGLNTGDELVLETTICNEIRQHNTPVIIEHVAKNEQFCNHKTPERYGFQSYISFPIFKKDGSFFGTLCAIDPEPAKLENKVIKDLFQLYTQLISFHLDAVEELEELNSSLKEERHIAELRETFIAILGHDLRNPVGTTRMCADILLKIELPEIAKRQARTIKATSYRMQALIDNLLDFAKGHLGDGISLEIAKDNNILETTLLQVIDEIRTVDPDHQILVNIDLKEEVECDHNRIGQLYSNLLSNAVKHGDPLKPIQTKVTAENGQFKLSVLNAGEKIPEEKMMSLFKPFFSTNSENNKSGLGLGLYISSEIAKAHGGKMKVRSLEDEIKFTFCMPTKVVVDLN